MRPLDIVVLLKIIALDDKPWQYRDLSSSLTISVSEISESLNRSSVAGLINGKNINRAAFMEFIQYGLQYVFPQNPGSLAIGIVTAHSHHFYQKHFSSESAFVWASQEGTVRGQTIEPLHRGVIDASLNDSELYLMLASIDILRVGRVREKKVALEELKKRIL